VGATQALAQSAANFRPQFRRGRKFRTTTKPPSL
jgi:hypothetical protein